MAFNARRQNSGPALGQKNIFADAPDPEVWTWKNPNPNSNRRHLVRFIPFHNNIEGIIVKTACGMGMRREIKDERIRLRYTSDINCGSCRASMQHPAAVPVVLLKDLHACVSHIRPHLRAEFQQFIPLDDARVPADWLEEQGDPAADVLRIVGRCVTWQRLIELFGELQS